jgi:hypothetical protein
MDAVLLPLAWVLLGAGYAIAIMEPMYRRKPAVNSSLRFYRADFLWLIVLLQWPLVGVAIARRWHANQGGQELLLGGILTLLVVALWLGFVSHLSHLRIRRSNRRGLFLVVVLPTTIVGGLTIGPIVVLAASVLSSPRAGIDVRGQCLLVLTLLVLISGGYASRRLNQWVARDADEFDE